MPRVLPETLGATDLVDISSLSRQALGQKLRRRAFADPLVVPAAPGRRRSPRPPPLPSPSRARWDGCLRLCGGRAPQSMHAHAQVRGHVHMRVLLRVHASAHAHADVDLDLDVYVSVCMPMCAPGCVCAGGWAFACVCARACAYV